MGGIENEETRRREVMRTLRIGYVAEEISREIGRPISVSEAAVLLSQLCEHANRLDEARIFMACAETLKEEMRSMRAQEIVAGASSGSEHQELPNTDTEGLEGQDSTGKTCSDGRVIS